MDLHENLKISENLLEDYMRERLESESARVSELSLVSLQDINYAVNILLIGLERDRAEQRDIMVRQEKLTKRTLFCAWCALIASAVSPVVAALSFVCQ